jgi:pimeloyl-ACP methyl ester carboxylesterase
MTSEITSFRVGTWEFPVTDRGPRKSAETVVLLHGFPQNARCWAAITPVLNAAGLRTLCPEQRGYAATARPTRTKDYRLARLAGDVEALLDAAGVHRAHVVGHDWGGGVAWALADLAPERVASLTVVSTPHPRALTRALLTSRQVLLSWYLLFFQLPWFPEWLVTRRGGRPAELWLRRLGLDASTAATYAKGFVEDRAALTGALNWYRALPLDIGYGFRARQITVPTTYVRGSHDAVVSTDAARLTARWVRSSYLFEEIPDGTHWLPEQRPQELAEIVLARVGEATRSSERR